MIKNASNHSDYYNYRIHIVQTKENFAIISNTSDNPQESSDPLYIQDSKPYFSELARHDQKKRERRKYEKKKQHRRPTIRVCIDIYICPGSEHIRREIQNLYIFRNEFRLLFDCDSWWAFIVCFLCNTIFDFVFMPYRKNTRAAICQGIYISEDLFILPRYIWYI